MFLHDLPLTNEHSRTKNSLGGPQSSASPQSVRATAASFGASLAMWDLCSWNSFLVSSKVRENRGESCVIFGRKKYGVVLCDAPSLPLDLRSPCLHQVFLLSVTKVLIRGVGSAVIEVLSLSPGSSSSLKLNRQKAAQVCLSLLPHMAPLSQPNSQLLIPSAGPTSLSKLSPHPLQGLCFSEQVLTE